MTVQLTQPFVWPRMPTDVKPWKRPEVARAKATQEQNEKHQKTLQKTGVMPLRDEVAATPDRKELKKEAKRLLKAGGWTNKRPIDLRFSNSGEAKKSSSE